MPIRSILATLAIASLSACAYPRAAIVTGTMVAVTGGVMAATARVRDCSTPDASELCGFDQLGDTIKQDTGAVIMVGGLALLLAGLVGLSNEHQAAATAPAPPTGPVPIAPAGPATAGLDAGWLRTMIGRDPLRAAADHRM
jgi:hypothetical protein